MLNEIRRINQEVNAAQDLGEVLDIIVRRIKELMRADVCSVYLTDAHTGQERLMANQGFEASAVGKVVLKPGQGLVGRVAAKAEPVNVDDAPSHADFHGFPGIGEERFHAFLGVPIIQHRHVLGVLVVQRFQPRRFPADGISSLVTLAAQLAGAISHAQVSGALDNLLGSQERADFVLDGLPGTPGVAIGQALAVYPLARLATVPDRPAGDVDREIRSFHEAVHAVRDQLEQLGERMERILPVGDQALFDAYLLMLSSDSLVQGVEGYIRGGLWAPAALRRTIEEHAQVFDSMDDDYLRERGADIRDLGRRVLAHLLERTSQQDEYPPQVVLVGDEVSAIQLAETPLDHLVAVVSAQGSSTSHVAILARALGITAVMGVVDLPVARMDGCEVVVDGYRGRICVSPSAGVLGEYQRLLREEEELSEGLMALRDEPAETPDGVALQLHLNAGLLADLPSLVEAGADGIGLYRTEFPFMVRDSFPGEDEQVRIYRRILKGAYPLPVTLRTLDVGGDKALPYFPLREDNPFLGWRGIRITLDHPEIFLTQLRAMLRASAGLGNLRILLPMVSELAQLYEAKHLLQQVLGELESEGCVIVRPQLGVMIEVPAAVYLADRLVEKVDFVSVGSNDLTQYLLAVDRNNARVASLYDALHPAVLRAIEQVVSAAEGNKAGVSVCGEMAGDPAAALLLLGMGVRDLSMNLSNLPRVKWVVRSFAQAEARTLYGDAMACDDAASIRSLATRALEARGLGGLVRAGK